MVQHVNPQFLHFNAPSKKRKEFLQFSFGVRLKQDFNFVYVDNYNHNGLDEDWLSIAKQGKLILDPNTKALVEFFEFFERKTLGTKEEEDCRPVEQQINE